MKCHALILGCGASLGVPPIHHPSAAEILKDPLNTRLRTSILLQIGEKQILIDPGPDFRFQALKYQIRRLDGVLITHTHFDHIGGMDELRAYYFAQKTPLPILLSKESFEDLKRRFDYLIDQRTQVVNKDQKFLFHVLPSDVGTTSLADVPIHYFTYSQAHMKITGFRVGTFAFVTDIKEYDPSIFSHLEGLDVLILSALRHEESPVHFNLQEAVAFSKKVQAKHTYFVHMSHELEYHHTNKQLPQGIRLAHDGLEVSFYV